MGDKNIENEFFEERKKTISEFFEQRKNTTRTNKIYLRNVYYAFTRDGKTCAPFVLDYYRSEVKDLNSGKCEPICKTNDEVDIHATLSYLYNTEDFVHYDNIVNMINKYTEGNNIAGFESFIKYELSFHDKAFREFIINNKFSGNLFINKENLKPLTVQIKDTIIKRYESEQNRSFVFLDDVKLY